MKKIKSKFKCPPERKKHQTSFFERLDELDHWIEITMKSRTKSSGCTMDSIGKKVFYFFILAKIFFVCF